MIWKKTLPDTIINAKIQENIKDKIAKNNIENRPNLLLGPKFSIIDDSAKYKTKIF